jgi:hypothetical protein
MIIVFGANLRMLVKHSNLSFVTQSIVILLGGVAIVFWFIQLLRNLIRREYIVYDEEKVTINESFRRWTFKRSEVDYISLNYAPFSQSYFKLNNGLKRKFNAWNLDKYDTDKLHIICNKVK